MDINQISKLIQYYDEERRKDRAIVVHLQERVEALTRELDARSRYAVGLETSISELKGQLSRALGWGSAVEQLRAEFSLGINRVEEMRQKTERETQRIRQLESEAIMRQINELKKEVKPYGRYNEEIEARKQEDARLAELIGRVQVQTIDIERRMDQPGVAIAYLEEQRRQDNRRILSLENDQTDMKRRIDLFPPQLLLLDEAVRRKQTEIEEASKLLESQSQLIENQRVADIRRDRQFAEYVETIERMKQRAEEMAVQATGFVQMREEVRRSVGEIPEFLNRMEVRINEVFELQRDAEERAKRISESFRDKVEKLQQDFVVAQDEKWHPRDKRISDQDDRIDFIEEEISKMPTLAPVYEIFEVYARHYAEAGREWLAKSGQLLERAKLNMPAESSRLSRRQKRKQQTVKEREIALPEQTIDDPDLLS
jgi:chromosome segregation ATPase